MDESRSAYEPEHKDDYDTCFKDTVWLSQFQLNDKTVMYYFALSPFYDKNCNNAMLSMQNIRFEDMKPRLEGETGIEYELLPNLSKEVPQTVFVIKKQRRMARTVVETLAVYYCVDETIYQAPSTLAMITSRLKKCSYRVNKAFRSLSAGVRFSSTEGYSWDFSTEEKKQPLIPSEQLALKLKRRQEKEEKSKVNNARVDAIVLSLVKKHAPEVIAAGAAALAPQSVPPAEQNPANDANPAPPKRQKV